MASLGTLRKRAFRMNWVTLEDKPQVIWDQKRGEFGTALFREVLRSPT